MPGYFNIVQIVLSVVLIVVILIQTKGPGFTGTFASDSSIYRSRRGIEKTLFQITIGLVVLFVAVSIAGALAAS